MSSKPRLRRAPVVQLDRTSACGAEGRVFESRRVYQVKKVGEPAFFTWFVAAWLEHMTAAVRGVVVLFGGVNKGSESLLSTLWNGGARAKPERYHAGCTKEK